jgi:SAM-dependent methyltransferase
LTFRLSGLTLVAVRLSFWRTSSETVASDPSYWDGISDQIVGNYVHDTVIGQLKREAHLRLVDRWCGSLLGKTVLKTDLFEEAHGPDQFLFELPIGCFRVGVDISPVIARRAREQALARRVPSCALLAGDVLGLPFRGDSVDIIVSNSTLDHFAHPALIGTALRELYRILKPGGTVLVTLDNPHSLSYLVGRLKRILRPDPYFLGHTVSIQTLRAMLTSIGYRVTDTTAILHGLENHSSAAMQVAGRIGGPRLQGAIGAVLVVMERLEAAPTRYLTGAFVAARAIKAERPDSAAASIPGSLR